ncbi:MAG TPA: VPLPA-CTERM sorting domain-containing protein [Steroidobacteraceae bacterium]|nr:VPLPA-CTERM sorting domain-containing protein [Steroidobacteraceae bacterium]
MFHRIHAIAALAGAVLLAATAAHAATYDFSTAPQGTTTTPYTINGATFSSTTAPAAFTFGQNGGLYSGLGNNVLDSLGTPAVLDISFATAQTGITFDFATGGSGAGSDTLTLATNTGFSQTVNATVPANSLYPQGLFNLASAAAFQSVTITAYDAGVMQSLVVADLASTPVPLPAAGFLLLSGLGGAAGFMRRRKAAV